MTRLIEILISLAIVTVLFLIVGLFLPSKRFLVEKVETNRKQTIVFDTLNGFNRFKDWNAIPLRDPKMKMSVSGPAAGVGAKFEFESEDATVGRGSWTIVESDPNDRIAIDIVDDRAGNNKRTEFKLKPTGRSGRNIEISQSYRVEYGWNLFGRFAGLYVRSHVGDDMKFSLTKLANMLASIPNVDYTSYGANLSDIGIVEVPAQHLLVVSAGTIEMKDELLEASMKSNMEWINRTLAANPGLVAAGPMHIVTSEQGRDSYTFDVALPVRRSADQGGAPTAPLTGLTLQGPVKYELTTTRRAIGGKFTGYVRQMQGVRDALRAWGAPRGYEVVGRPFEVYNSSIIDSYGPDGKFDVYWAIK